MGRPRLLLRALDNLLDNAAKFGPAEGVIEITVRAGVVAVHDQGPGVAPECFAVAQGNTPRRGIYCQADAWGSAEEALDYVSHELTHQVEQGDTAQRRGIAQWFNEGFAEYIQGRVLAERSHQLRLKKYPDWNFWRGLRRVCVGVIALQHGHVLLPQSGRTYGMPGVAHR